MTHHEFILTKLAEAKQLISDPKHWTQGFYARDDAGNLKYHWEDFATCWCSIGALRKVNDSGDYSTDLLELALECATKGESVAHFNDHNTHADVMAMFDRAIEAERAKSHVQDH